ncbi:WecB/TagA/CpsF family glycosyltransferase [Geomonas sp. Red32]|uniref:WecB/TagA/CpsF family glycosyltransferase n=1 Tax=Geomonas sp. Red32 TaxID=2912856 RepID=UPI00202CD810|nr:WecB/TagA/CpsF family glycosyltransferase [Geomonas sp. Red32]MCM0081383.1 WecB/TagA/CpsF family glycosyltransferase [Geomonas sp. Red32]
MTQTAHSSGARWGVKRIPVCGLGIDSLTLNELMPLLDRMVESSNGSYVSFVDGNLFARALQDPTIVEVLSNATMALPDGAMLMVASRLLGEPLAQRLVGPNVLLSYLRHAAPLGRRHFLYGGAPGIAELMKEKLTAEIPGLRVVGTYCPPFRPLTEEEEGEVKRMIEESGAEVIWVGLGAPKQDIWMAEHVGRIQVPLMLGVGAAFDYLSGTKKRAPLIVQRLGMEWLHRMCTQGGRIFWRNAKSLPLSFYSVVKEVVRVRVGGARTGGGLS